MNIKTNMKTWTSVLGSEKEKDYFKSILRFLHKKRLMGKRIYPAQSDVFNALKLTSYESVKVVIIGQDPYHGPHQAHGLSFSVRKGVAIPPSLQNIFKELHNDLGISKPHHGCLEKWSKQGVLLLNEILTVEAGKPASHAEIGWQNFTNKIISSLNNHESSIVFLLWGKYAQKKSQLITNLIKHYILKTTHPSPFSAHLGFLGCKHFSKTNTFLKKMGRDPIDWRL